MNNEIVFKFIQHRFDYKLPDSGIDLEFLKDRRCEVIGCMQQLAKKVSSINIATKKGVSEFEIASQLVKYYFFALVLIESKQDDLTNGTVVNANNYAPYTGKLSQGRG